LEAGTIGVVTVLVIIALKVIAINPYPCDDKHAYHRAYHAAYQYAYEFTHLFVVVYFLPSIITSHVPSGLRTGCDAP
jgi:hypothetical protein